MILYINTILRRTQRPGIFSLVSEEGGAESDKRAVAGQQRAAPPSVRIFPAMPALVDVEKRTVIGVETVIVSG